MREGDRKSLEEWLKIDKFNNVERLVEKEREKFAKEKSSSYCNVKIICKS